MEMPRPITSLLVALFGLATATAAIGAEGDCSDGGPPGDGKVRDRSVATAPMDSSSYPTDHTQADMVGWIASWNSTLADEIDDALNSGCVTLVQLLEGGPPGTSDATTIAVKTRGQPLWWCGMVLYHEYRHWLNARAACLLPGNGNPSQGDPETADDNPCGKCNHAGMFTFDVLLMAEWCNEFDQTDLKILCGWSSLLFKAMNEILKECRYSGCTACCGFDYIPNAGQIHTTPPCCY